MRKVLILLVAVVTLMAFNVTGVLGATVSADFLFNGPLYGTDSNHIADGKLFILNAEEVWKDTNYKFGADLTTGTYDGIGNLSDYSVDYTSYDIKAGYRICKKKKINIDLTASLYQGKMSLNGYSGDFTVTGLLFGADLVYDASKKVFWEASLVSSLSASTEVDANGGSVSTNDTTITNYRIKFNYLISNNSAISLGYRSYDHNYDGDVDGEYRITGFTLGVTHHF